MGVENLLKYQERIRDILQKNSIAIIMAKSEFQELLEDSTRIGAYILNPAESSAGIFAAWHAVALLRIFGCYIYTILPLHMRNK